MGLWLVVCGMSFSSRCVSIRFKLYVIVDVRSSVLVEVAVVVVCGVGRVCGCVWFVCGDGAYGVKLQCRSSFREQ